MNGHIIFQYVGRPLFVNFISIKCVNNWLIYMVSFEGWVGNIPHPHLPLQRHTHVHTYMCEHIWYKHSNTDTLIHRRPCSHKPLRRANYQRWLNSISFLFQTLLFYQNTPSTQSQACSWWHTDTQSLSSRYTGRHTLLQRSNIKHHNEN